MRDSTEFLNMVHIFNMAISFMYLIYLIWRISLLTFLTNVTVMPMEMQLLHFLRQSAYAQTNLSLLDWR